MERHRQTLEEILSSLSPIQSEWRDEFAGSVIDLLDRLPTQGSYTVEDVRELLRQDFDAGLTLARLFLDMSKDELAVALREAMRGGGIGVKSFRAGAEPYLQALQSLGLLERMTETVTTPVTWKDVLVERLKSGRGSAIKGQRRGKFLEDFTEVIVLTTFGKGSYDVRCRFLGANGQRTEKADFAIPSKEDPRILIEVKAYGATGSKLTDILGDMARIVEQKRHDTTLLFVTDGITWRSRANDLRKLVEMQNQGRIARIYTRQMESELRDDLSRLKVEHGL